MSCGSSQGRLAIATIVFLGLSSLVACVGETAQEPVARPGDRGFRCDDGRIAVVRQTDPSEITLDLGDRRLYLRRQSNGSYAAKGNTLAMRSAGATLTTPPAAPTACRSYDPHGALPPPGTR